MPTVSRPMPSTRGRRPVATSRRSPRSSRPSSSSEDVVVAVAAGGGRVPPEDELDAVAAQDLAERLAQRRGLAGEHVSAPSTSATSPPRRRTACAISTPTGPPPSTSSRRGTAFMPVASRLVQMPSSSRRPGIGGMIGSAPLARTTCRRCGARRRPRPRRSRRAGPAAQQVDAVVGQPALLAGVGVVGDHEVAPGERGLDVDLRGRRRVARAVHRLARPQQRLGRDARPVGALAADQLALDDGDAQPALGERAGAVLKTLKTSRKMPAAIRTAASAPRRSRLKSTIVNAPKITSPATA